MRKLLPTVALLFGLALSQAEPLPCLDRPRGSGDRTRSAARPTQPPARRAALARTQQRAAALGRRPTRTRDQRKQPRTAGDQAQRPGSKVFRRAVHDPPRPDSGSRVGEPAGFAALGDALRDLRSGSGSGGLGDGSVLVDHRVLARRSEAGPQAGWAVVLGQVRVWSTLSRRCRSSGLSLRHRSSARAFRRSKTSR